MEKEFKAIYGQAMSIVTHKPSQYAKNITLRYPMKSTFKGDKIRICLIQSQLDELLVDVI